MSQCPTCHEQSSFEQAHHVEIGICFSCKHVWPETDNSKNKKCPACSKKNIDKFNYSSSRGLRLDSCEGCHSTFITEQEGNRIIERMAELEKKMTAEERRYGQLLQNDARETEMNFEQFNKVTRFKFLNKFMKKLFNW